MSDFVKQHHLQSESEVGKNIFSPVNSPALQSISKAQKKGKLKNIECKKLLH